MNVKQFTFSEMSKKTVINVADGRELGHVCDMVFNNCGGVMGFIVPGKKSFFKTITSAENIFIPWNRIIKIGSDVILTECVGSASMMSANQSSAKAQSYREYPVEATQTCSEPSATAQAYSTPTNITPAAAEAYANPPTDDNPERTSRYDYAPTVENASAQTYYHD